MKRYALIAGAIIAGALTTSAPAGTLFGIVKDENGSALAGAKVVVYNTALETTSGADGKFKIESPLLLDGNKYSVTVSARGYDASQTLAQEVFNDLKEMEPLEIQMTKEEPLPAADTNLPPAAAAGVLTPEGMLPSPLPEPGSNVVQDALLPNLDEAASNAPAPGATNAPAKHP